MAASNHPYLTAGITVDSVPVQSVDRDVSLAIESVLHDHLVSDPQSCLRDIMKSLHDQGFHIAPRTNVATS